MPLFKSISKKTDRFYSKVKTSGINLIKKGYTVAIAKTGIIAKGHALTDV